MPRISSLPKDGILSGNETLIGTDTNTGQSSKFILSDVKDYVNTAANTETVALKTNGGIVRENNELLLDLNPIPGDISLSDEKKIKFGADNDLEISHSALTDSVIQNNNGGLFLDQRNGVSGGNPSGAIYFRANDGSGGITPYQTINGNNQTVVFHKTIDAENSITLPSATTNSNNPDKGFIQFGTGSPSPSRIYNQTASFRIEAESNGNLELHAPNIQLSGNHNTQIAAGDTGVRLHYRGSEKFTTTDTGVTVKGALAIQPDGTTDEKVVRFGQVTMNNGTSTQTFTVSGLTASSIVTATIANAGNSDGNGTLKNAQPGTNSLTINVDHVVNADNAVISYIAIG